MIRWFGVNLNAGVCLRGRLPCFLLAALLAGCGGGGGGSDDEEATIADRGFADKGIFVGQSEGTEVLLVLEDPSYFLLVGEFASSGQYSITSVELTGEGVAYDLAEQDQVTGNLELAGEFDTDRHLQLTWRQPSTGLERTSRVEATNLYFEDSPIEKVLGSWINQDEGNLTFINVSENRTPIAGNDFFPVEPGEQTEIPVLENDRDPDGDEIFVSDLDASSSTGGALVLDDGGTPDDPTDDRVLYTPPDSLTSGTDTFSYDIEDEEGGSDTAVVTLTLPVREVDIALSMSTPDEAPLAGDVVPVTVTLSNTDEVAAQVQPRIDLSDGLEYRDDEGDGVFDPVSGHWAVNLPAGETRSIQLDLLIANFGDFDMTASISALDAVDTDSSNNVAELTFVPGELASEPPVRPKTAQIEGIILSSLSQISGTISESKDLRNAYGVTIRLGSGGLGGGGGTTDPFTGFIILDEELVDQSEDEASSDDGTDENGDDGGDDNNEEEEEENGDSGNDEDLELRPTMLILTSNPSGVYLNKLFFVSEEELSEDEEPAED